MIVLADGAWIMRYNLTSKKQKSSYSCDIIKTSGVINAEKVAQYSSGCAARIIENGWIMDY